MNGLDVNMNIIVNLYNYSSAEDFSPTAPQSGSLLGTSTNPLCLPFSAIDDSVSDEGETFSVVLTNSDNFPSGPGGLQVSRDSVDITILERIPPTPGVDVEGMYLYTCIGQGF